MFVTEGGTKNVKVSDSKTISAYLIKNFSFFSLEHKVDMAEVLSYPLTQGPLPLIHVNGATLKTKKSALISTFKMKALTRTSGIKYETALVFLCLLYNLSSTFGKVAKVILSNIMKTKGNVIRSIFDKWISPSIKISERNDRMLVNTSFQFTGSP